MPQFASQDLRSIVSGASGFGGGGRAGATIQYVISGPELSVLTKASQEALAKFKEVPGVVDADTSLKTGNPELKVQINRDLAAQLGVAPADIATALRYFVGGSEVTTYNEKGRAIRRVSARSGAVSQRPAEHRRFDGSLDQVGRRPVTAGGEFRRGHRPRLHRALQRVGAGHAVVEHQAGRLADRDFERAGKDRRRPQFGAGLHRRAGRLVQRVGAHRQFVLDGDCALVHLYVSDFGGAVRELGSPDHDFDELAPHGSVSRCCRCYCSGRASTSFRCWGFWCCLAS